MPVQYRTGTTSEMDILTTPAVPVSFPEFFPEILWTIVPLIVIVNGVVMITIARIRQLRVTANYFVFSMASCDFFVGSVLLPTLLIRPESPAVGALVMFTLMASLGLSCACTYDRYLAVIWALRYQELMPKKKAVYLIGAICLLAAVLAALPQIWIQQAHFKFSLEHRIYIGCIVGIIMIATGTEGVVYLIIFRIARRHAKDMSKMRRKRTQLCGRQTGDRCKMQVLIESLCFAKSFMLVSLTMFLFWLPVGYINIVDDVMGRPDLMPIWIQEISFYSTFFSSLIHPILYGLFQKKLRSSILLLIPRRIRMRMSLKTSKGDDREMYSITHSKGNTSAKLLEVAYRHSGAESTISTRLDASPGASFDATKNS